MKAITFLEWCKRIKQWHSDNDSQKKIINDALFKVYESERFYSQPFKPEMITEYFEGWECVSANEDGWEFHCKDYVIEITGDEIIDIGYVDNLDLIPLTPALNLPKTVDSFKTLLEEQAGIELTFKPEIETKYFK